MEAVKELHLGLISDAGGLRDQEVLDIFRTVGVTHILNCSPGASSDELQWLQQVAPAAALPVQSEPPPRSETSCSTSPASSCDETTHGWGGRKSSDVAGPADLACRRAEPPHATLALNGWTLLVLRDDDAIRDPAWAEGLAASTGAEVVVRAPGPAAWHGIERGRLTVRPGRAGALGPGEPRSVATLSLPPKGCGALPYVESFPLLGRLTIGPSQSGSAYGGVCGGGGDFGVGGFGPGPGSLPAGPGFGDCSPGFGADRPAFGTLRAAGCQDPFAATNPYLPPGPFGAPATPTRSRASHSAESRGATESVTSQSSMAAYRSGSTGTLAAQAGLCAARGGSHGCLTRLASQASWDEGAPSGCAVSAVNPHKRARGAGLH